MKTNLLLGLFCTLTCALSAINLMPGDTGFETECDTLLSGNLDTGLLPATWDDGEAAHGTRSLRIDWDRKNRRLYLGKASNAWTDQRICPDSGPLKDGAIYTFSFYAKAQHENTPLNLVMLPNAGWNFWKKGSSHKARFILTSQWKRYSATFTTKLTPHAPYQGYSFQFDFSMTPACKLWLDSLQLEEGTQASTYEPASVMSCGICMTPCPVARENRTTLRYIYYTGDSLETTVRITSQDGKPGELLLKTIDHERKTILNRRQQVKPGDTIAFTSKATRKGWFKTTAILTRGKQEIARHSINFAVIDRPAVTHPKVEPFFGMIGHNSQIELMKRIGVKRIQISQNWKQTHLPALEPTAGHYDFRSLETQLRLGKTHGMKTKLCLKPFFPPAWYVDPSTWQEAKNYFQAQDSLVSKESMKAWDKLVMTFLEHDAQHVDELDFGCEDNGRLGRNGYYRAKHPEWLVDNWVAKGEAFKTFYDQLAQTCKTVKHRYPHIKTGLIRPSQGREGDNWIFIEKALQRIGKHFDVFPVDIYLMVPYALGPEIKNHNGSLEGRSYSWNLIQALLKKYGKQQPVFMSEAGLQGDTLHPDDSPSERERAELMAKDFFLCRALGFYAYDLFCAISTYTTERYNFSLAYNHRLQMALPAISTAARTLENSLESSYQKMPGATRICLFRKVDGSGSAALWADAGYFFKPQSYEGIAVTDMMGNGLTPSPEGKFSLGTAPLILHAKSFNTLKLALKEAEFGQQNFCTLQCDVQRKDTLTMKLINLSNKHDVRLTATVSSDAGIHHTAFSVPCAGNRILSMPAIGQKATITLTNQENDLTLSQDIDLPRLQPIRQVQTQIASVKDRSQILPNESWTSWSGLQDLSATISAAWDPEYLMLEVNVLDDRHFQNSTRTYNADSLQIAVDPLSNAGLQHLIPGTLGPDDVECGIALSSKTDKTFTTLSKGSKALLTPENCQVLRNEQKGTTTYKIRLSWEKLGVTPQKGTVVGMSFVLFDDDTGQGWDYYGFVGGGIAGGKDPRKYLKYVLEE